MYGKINLLLLLSIMISGLSYTSVFAKRLVLGCAPSFPFVDENLTGQGFYTQIVVAAGQKAGIKIIPKIMPWKRVIAESKSGSLDGTFCIAVTQQRRSWLEFTKNAFYISEVGIFTHRDVPLTWSRPADLESYTIGSLASTVYAKKLAGFGLKIQEYPNTETGLRMLHGQRFDAIYDTRIVIQYLLKSKFPDFQNKIVYSKTMDRFNLHIAIGKHHPKAAEIVKKLDIGYRHIKQDGSLEEILAKIQ